MIQSPILLERRKIMVGVYLLAVFALVTIGLAGFRPKVEPGEIRHESDAEFKTLVENRALGHLRHTLAEHRTSDRLLQEAGEESEDVVVEGAEENESEDIEVEDVELIDIRVQRATAKREERLRLREVVRLGEEELQVLADEKVAAEEASAAQLLASRAAIAAGEAATIQAIAAQQTASAEELVASNILAVAEALIVEEAAAAHALNAEGTDAEYTYFAAEALAAAQLLDAQEALANSEAYAAEEVAAANDLAARQALAGDGAAAAQALAAKKSAVSA